MNLTPQAVDAYKELMTNPEKHGLDFPPLSEFFEISLVATPKHLLYADYLIKIDKTRDRLPKVFFYIIMDEMYPQAKAPDGNLGYLVRIKSDATTLRGGDQLIPGANLS